MEALIEGKIDFHGQDLAKKLMFISLSAVVLFSYLLGWSLRNIYFSLYAGIGGIVLTFLIMVPAWPMYNKNPIPWGQNSDIVIEKQE